MWFWHVDLTGSISSVEEEGLVGIPYSNIEQSMQGKLAGVDVTPYSGEPGAAMEDQNRLVGNVFAEYNFIPGLQYRLRFGVKEPGTFNRTKILRRCLCDDVYDLPYIAYIYWMNCS